MRTLHILYKNKGYRYLPIIDENLNRGGQNTIQLCTFPIHSYTIVYMSKQIQVSDTLYKRLKMAADGNYRTLSGQLEYLMDYYGSGQTPTGEKIVPKVDVSDLLKDSKPTGISGSQYDSYEKKSEATPDFGTVAVKQVEDVVPTDLEFACCSNETRPCKHWVWDSATGEGYRNTLSGRFREAE